MIVIDRIEEGTAVLEEDGRISRIPVSQLPKGAKEGSVLVRTESGFVTDPETERRLRSENARRLKRLLERK